ncbi:uncharacterized protein MYCFIDRAFT_198930 [Pseudocercospora fijiensis CIRAD86]|uniref:Transcription factor MYCFIDRAFT_198930 n=1 Tax=Pseudocercospora fijiensis (strain CIRAD86) TaxID=383855 RepID=PK81E_PSEFD|nr:uncharacterized protein MYCFIDRAFT_198930 [Pseudocercospora fijiensis CIRAD86]M3APK0.1 RecName: Full=Transcription factor MYCFIDRAFT_198930; AltName: Full=PKS8-1 gene cluster protein MYCFIDRAFT_198930 [Pseudocercospora fijiensis CIRAD86]EME79053.1 hypothetical protein MYCFIDRAFT_198930 [Pseudocercospora fijiensis CIRAD86]
MSTTPMAAPPGADLKPVTSSRGRSSTSDEQKLRSSCESCAQSKLKCSGDKPACARCAKRGLACKYVIAKRGGRKPKGYTSTNDNNPSKRREDSHSPAASQWSSTGHLEQSYPYCDPTISGSASPALIAMSDFYNPMDQNLPDAPTSHSDISMDFDFNDCFSLGFPSSNELSDFCNVGSTDMFSPSLDSSSSSSTGPERQLLCDGFSLTDDAMSDLFPLSPPEPQQQISCTPTDKNPHSYQEACLNGSCSCLVEALSLMKQLVSSPARNGAASPPNIQTIIDRNEATIESVRRMLECSCSQDDGYLLSVMSLIIFRVLGWYATVARQTACDVDSQPSRSPQSSISSAGSGYCLEGADSARMAAQLVLSEIHHVRRIVHQLSLKLKAQGEKERSRPETRMEGLEAMDNEMTLPLSATMYDQLDVDLKKRLRALSWEMIDRLRRY